jgi:uncharacterized membrane protein YhdT
VSRRSKRGREPQAAGVEPAADDSRAAEARGKRAASWSLGLQLLFLAVVFAVVVLVAELAGAANLGVAFGVGQIAFAIAVIYLLLRR